MRRILSALLPALSLLLCQCSVVNQLDDLKGSPDASVEAGTGGVAGSAGAAGSAGSGASSGVLPTGALCATDNSCQTGFCVAGMCCDKRCDSPCLACTAAAKEDGEDDGTCGPAKAGTDPRNDCADEGAMTCGKDGKCDGKGGCRLYGNGTRCSDATCSGGIKKLPKACDGSGSCLELGQVICNPLQCAGNLCVGDCETDAACQATEFCDTIQNRCVTKLTDGTACTTANVCQSGFCADGVCCESACQGTCMSCAAALSTGKDGECAPILDGTDPKTQCNDEGPSSCGTDGQCDGKGACRFYGVTAVCAAATCSGTTLNAAKTCDGKGNCASNGSSSCKPYICGSGACLTSCSGNGDCDGTSICTGSVCQGPKSNGATCSSAAECQSAFCVDGVCCNSACTGSCKACSAAKKGTGANGVCANVASGFDPDGNCSSQSKSTCGRDGQCDGNGGCRLWSSGTQCGSPSCGPNPASPTVFLAHYADTCDGAGKCVDKGTVACGLYTCNGSACRTSCTSSTQCALGVCNSTSNVCYFSCGISPTHQAPRGPLALLALTLAGVFVRRRRSCAVHALNSGPALRVARQVNRRLQRSRWDCFQADSRE